MTKYTPKKRVDIVSLAIVKESSVMYEGRKCNSPQAAYELLAPFIQNKDREHLVVVGLSTKVEPNVVHVAHIGGLNQSLAIPRDILKAALLSNSNSIIIAHNHPSGDPTPSKNDIAFTRRLRDACEILNITLDDHIVIGSTGEYVSLREDNYVEF